MKISIITINYNNCGGLKKTIDSVLSQTWTDYEYIIIDGGSTDGSREVIESVSEHLTYWCSEPDNGIYHAMNKGISQATGDFLIFMNSGDRFHNNKVLENVFDGQEYDEEIISGQVVRDDTMTLQRIYRKNLTLQLLYDTINHQGTFIRRTLFENIKYDESLQIVSDWKFWLQKITLENTKVHILDTNIAIQEPLGISSNSEKCREERKKVMTELFGERLANELPELYRETNIPAVQRLLYLEKHSYRLFIFCHRVIAIVTLLHKKLFQR